jgi:hypothetical protein
VAAISLVVVRPDDLVERFGLPGVAVSRRPIAERVIPGSAVLFQFVIFRYFLFGVQQRALQQTICLRVFFVNINVFIFVWKKAISLFRVQSPNAIFGTNLNGR